VQSMRLPRRGACSIGMDGDVVVFTLPRDAGADGIERCHAVMRGVARREGWGYSFYVQAVEAEHVSKSLPATWGGLRMRCPSTESLTLEVDVPGPLHVVSRRTGDFIHFSIGLRVPRDEVWSA
jgi:hypothetical protein